MSRRRALDRRRLLAALATGSAASLAGCGYAYGGGDVRDVESAGGAGVFAFDWSAHEATGTRLVFAESGDSPFEGERTAVSVVDRDADETGTFRHDGLSVGMAVGPDAERVYLRESAGGVVAVTPAADDDVVGADGVDDGDDGTDGNGSSGGSDSDDGIESDGSDETSDGTDADRVDDADDRDGSDPGFSRVDAPDWRASLVDVLGEPAKGTDPVERREAEPIAADARGAYVGSGSLVIAAREGRVDWTVEVDEPVRGLWCGGSGGPDGVVVATATSVAGFGPDGSRRWRYESGAGPSPTVDGDLVLLRGGDELLALDRPGGTVAWRTETGGDGPPPTVTGDRVAAVSRGELRVLDRGSGDPLWRAGAAPGRDRLRSLVVDAERAYFVDRDGEAVAVDSADAGGGRAWTRALEVRSSTVVDGWIDGETVAFAFDTGEFVWLQRYDEDPGLL